MTEPKTKTAAAKATPAERLAAAVEALRVAAIDYAESEEGTVHDFTVEGFRLRFAGPNLLALNAV